MLAVLNIVLIVYTLSRTSRRVADCVLTSERTREYPIMLNRLPIPEKAAAFEEKET